LRLPDHKPTYPHRGKFGRVKFELAAEGANGATDATHDGETCWELRREGPQADLRMPLFCSKAELRAALRNSDLSTPLISCWAFSLACTSGVELLCSGRGFQRPAGPTWQSTRAPLSQRTSPFVWDRARRQPPGAPCPKATVVHTTDQPWASSWLSGQRTRVPVRGPRAEPKAK